SFDDFRFWSRPLLNLQFWYWIRIPSRLVRLTARAKTDRKKQSSSRTEVISSKGSLGVAKVNYWSKPTMCRPFANLSVTDRFRRLQAGPESRWRDPATWANGQDRCELLS